jgi:hypothetical protein
MKHVFEEIKPQLSEVLQIKLWSVGHLPFFRAKVKNLIVVSKHVAHRPP